jgi:hypothetical protein
MAVSKEDIFKWNELHNRLISGDVIVSAEIAEYFMPLAVDRLSKRFKNIDDPHLIETAVIDAIMDYLTSPSQYDPCRGNLFGYLILKAKSDLLNYLGQKKIDHSLMDLAEIVELEDDSSVYGIELTNEMDIETEIIEKSSPLWERLSKLITDKTDQEMVLLIMNGVRDTDTFAEVIGIQKLPNKEKIRIVKQNKDRLKKVIQRHFRVEELKND